MSERMPDYAQGFKDGFAAGLEQGKKLFDEQWRINKINELEKSLPKPQPRLDDYIFGAAIKSVCPKCGMNFGGVMGFVCNSPNCPTRVTSYATGAISGQLTGGAVGAVQMGQFSVAPGANGPAGGYVNK